MDLKTGKEKQVTNTLCYAMVAPGSVRDGKKIIYVPAGLKKPEEG